MIFLIPDYHTGKTLSKQFQLWFPAHHKKLVKLNENQSILTKKFRTIFREKSYQGMLWSRWDPSRHQGLSEWYHGVIPKPNGVQFRKSLGNIKFLKFLPGWTNSKICIGEVENSNFSQQGVVLKARFPPGSFPGWIQLGHWGRVFKFRRWLRIKKAFYVLQN